MDEKEKRTTQHVNFAGEPTTRPSASSPLGATSPRALKILSRKKTPFTEDLESSLEAFREIENARAILDAQKQEREEEGRRLNELKQQEPIILIKTNQDEEDKVPHGRSVTVISPQYSRRRRDELEHTNDRVPNPPSKNE